MELKYLFKICTGILLSELVFDEEIDVEKLLIQDILGKESFSYEVYLDRIQHVFLDDCVRSFYELYLNGDQDLVGNCCDMDILSFTKLLMDPREPAEFSLYRVYNLLQLNGLKEYKIKVDLLLRELESKVLCTNIFMSYLKLFNRTFQPPP